MQRKAEQAEQAAKEGRMADAQQQMAELERMLDQLRNARAQGNDGKQANSKRQRGKRQQSVVQDLIAREGGLLDHAQQRAGQNPPSAPGDPAAQREADSRVQQALRRALGELMQQFTDLTGEASPGLGEADQAMRDSGTRAQPGVRRGCPPGAAAGDRGAAKRQQGDGPGDGAPARLAQPGRVRTARTATRTDPKAPWG